ncbi:MAG: hydrogenase/urease maturation nickel metallochaperone HypA [Candidatus Omnitrophica bacterium]|nr:hydrogenase/urease maturation nickel metallochaperone HypA [Candidatus Omnitrophota bacterium]MDD5574509.1 hydrogenase/urease maturation nickel metallochaperone HypA [Candidatus Omnitrophota bacterium]
MHETKAIKEMLGVIRQVQGEHAGRTLASVCVELSEFGGWDEEHFREHFQEAVRGTPWQAARLDIKKVMMGPEAKLVRVTFEEDARGED